MEKEEKEKKSLAEVAKKVIETKKPQKVNEYLTLEPKKGKKMFDPAMKCPSCGEPMLFQIGGGRVKCHNCGEETGDLDNLEMYKSSHGTSSLEDFIPPSYKGHLEEEDPPNTDITEEDVERFGKDALKGLSGKKAWEEDDELDAYTKDLEDYLEKNPKAKDKNYY